MLRNRWRRNPRYPDMRIIITAVTNLLHHPIERRSLVARLNPIIMRKIHIAIIAIALVMFTAACGTESADLPTSTRAPTPFNSPLDQGGRLTATVRPADTPVPAPTVEATQATADATEKPEPTMPAPATEPPEPTVEPVAATAPERDLDIVTLLPFDGIPAIDNPEFFPDIEAANENYNDGELVLGVEIDGDARAYSVPLLSSHEIVNDVVGGKPIAVTW